MKHRTDKEYYKMELKTALQWAKEKKLPNDMENEGILLWCNPYHGNKARYFTPEEVHAAGKEELDAFLRPFRERRNQARKKLRENEKKEQKRCIQQMIKDFEIEKEDAVKMERLKVGIKLRKQILELAMYMPVIESTNHTGGIVFDVETTGQEADSCEVLQISIIDMLGNVLFDSYIKPYYTEEWKEAEAVNGISKEMVENAPYPHEVLPRIRGIFNQANLIVGYNVSFDISFMEKWGISIEKKQLFDVMCEFAPVYGEWNDYYQNYKWKSLSVCASWYGYDFVGHNSLEDARATLYCYNRLTEK